MMAKEFHLDNVEFFIGGTKLELDGPIKWTTKAPTVAEVLAANNKPMGWPRRAPLICSPETAERLNTFIRHTESRFAEHGPPTGWRDRYFGEVRRIRRKGTIQGRFEEGLERGRKLFAELLGQIYADVREVSISLHVQAEGAR